MYGNVATLMVEEITSSSPTEQKEKLLSSSVAETTRVSAVATTTSLSGFSLPTHSVAVITDSFHAPTLDRYLQDRLPLYKTPFSLLPPGKRLRIHRIGVDAPIIDVAYASAEQMEHGKFEEQLTQGVVKYPFTSEP